MSARFDILPTPLSGCIVVRRRPIIDERGAFERVFCAEDLAPHLGSTAIVQINRSLSRTPGTVRGLHWQNPPHAEVKIVTCLSGAVFDVAVDLRRGSPTFLRWYGRVLSAAEPESLVVPEGFAHGFQVLEPDSVLLYSHSAAHAPPAEAGLDACDPRLGIAWPLPVAQRSSRDAALPGIDGFEGVEP